MDGCRWFVEIVFPPLSCIMCFWCDDAFVGHSVIVELRPFSNYDLDTVIFAFPLKRARVFFSCILFHYLDAKHWR